MLNSSWGVIQGGIRPFDGAGRKLLRSARAQPHRVGCLTRALTGAPTTWPERRGGPDSVRANRFTAGCVAIRGACPCA